MAAANQCPQCKVPLHFDGFTHACSRCGVRQPRVNTDSRQCQRCGGFLHLHGLVMTCGQCTLPHPGHPKSIEAAAHAAAQKGKASTIPFIAPATLAVPADARTQALERAIDALDNPKKTK